MEVLCKSSRSGLIFARENKFIQGIFFRTRGSGAGLYTDKHCWIRKTNMATVWRFRRGFTSVFSLLVRSQRWSQITDSTKKKYTIFKCSWKYLIGKKCLFLWTICVHRTSLYLMRVGARWPLQGFFLKSTSIWHGLRHILRETIVMAIALEPRTSNIAASK